ncbi:hypothetical protein HAX54_049914, partial [Datura stramonium]|nr:hypothetical protein [Datura stramonium]
MCARMTIVIQEGAVLASLRVQTRDYDDSMHGLYHDFMANSKGCRFSGSNYYRHCTSRTLP